MRAVVAAGPVSQPMIRSALFSVLTDIGTPSSLDVQQIADKRRAISAFGVGLEPSATESTPEVVQHEVSVSLGIVGTMDGVRMTRPSLDLAILCYVDPDGIFESEPGSIPVGAIVETGTAWGVPAAVEPPVLFLPAKGARHLVGIFVGIGSHRR